LIENNVDIDATSKSGDNALIIGTYIKISLNFTILLNINNFVKNKASSKGFLDLIQLFLNNGSNFNICTNYELIIISLNVSKEDKN